VPLVDVITPVKNTPFHYLSTAIESVLSQTVNDYQIIIINDGSSTNYREDLIKYLSRLNNDKILLLDNFKNCGPPFARNIGIESFSSKYVAFLDSDDFWFSNKLENQLEIMENGKGYSLIHSDVEYIDGTGALISSRSSIPKQDFNKLKGIDLILYLISRNRIETLSVMVTRDSLNKVGYFDENFLRVEDWDLWLRYAMLNEPMYYQNKVLASYRKHQSSISHDYELVHKFKEKLFNKTFKELRKRSKDNIPDSFENEIFRKLYKLTGRRLYNAKNYKKAVEYFKLSREFGFDYDCLRREFKCILKSWLISL